MKNIIMIQNIVKSFAVAVAVLVFAMPTASVLAANITFNTSGADCATVRVRNTTQGIPSNGVGTTGCDSLSAWTTSAVSANPGDIISVAIYYHNTGTVTATNTKIKVSSGSSMAAGYNHTVSANIAGGNGGYASGGATINLTQPQTLQFLPGQTQWYDNGNNPHSVSGDQNLFNGTGVLANNDGVVSPYWADQGTLVVKFKVGSQAQAPVTPDVVTGNATSVDVNDVTLHGTVNNYNTPSMVWFKVYNQNLNLINFTPQTAVNAGNAVQSFSHISNGPFVSGQTYSYQACALYYNIGGSEDCGSYQTFSITPVATYQCNDGADNDGDGYTDMNDGGCSSSTDNDEYNYVQPTVYQCNDGADNDGDGYTDMNDAGCSSSTDNNEYNIVSSNLEVNTFVADSISETSARLRGEVDQIGNQNVIRYFEWGTSMNNLSNDLTLSGSVSYTGNFDRTLSGLNSNQTYYFRACAREINSNITDCGVIRDFKTNGAIQNAELVVLTTEASSVGQSAAILNGLAISTDVNITSMWFEWGTSTNVSQSTSHITINASGTQSLSRSISGLSSNTIYYYRAVAEDANGNTERGEIKFFRTTGQTVIISNPPIIIENSVDTSGAGSLFLALDIQPDFDNVIIGDTIDYTVKYRNISNSNLRNVVIQVTLAEETQFMKSTAGFYSDADHNITVLVGDLDEDERGEFVVRVKVLRGIQGDIIVAQANAGHDHPTITEAQVGTVPAYAVNHVVSNQNRLLGLALFGGAFFPTTFLGWLILLLIIAFLVLMARKYYADYEEKQNKGSIKIN